MREREAIERRRWGLCALLAAVLLFAVGAFASVPTAFAEDSGSQDMYRLYNPNSGEHFYTASAQERDDVAAAGWSYEGIGWVAPVESSTPVYRLYSGTDHHYTTSEQERDDLIEAGWSYEGIGWYSSDAQTVPVYRQFNPYVKPTWLRYNSGSHNYTTSKEENDSLVAAGWQAEGIGWYAIAAGTPSGAAKDYKITRVYLDAGHGWGSRKAGQWDPGASGGSFEEAVETRELTNKVAAYLDEFDIPYYTNANTDASNGVYYGSRQQDAADHDCTMFIAIHFNADGGTGYESYIHSSHAAEGSEQIQQIMMKHLKKAYGSSLKDRGSKTAALAVTSGLNTGIPASLLEVCFIDNAHDMQVYKANEDNVAREIALGIVECSEAGF